MNKWQTLKFKMNQFIWKSQFSLSNSRQEFMMKNRV